ncbi:MAG: MotA/TolQ/ExbB proton channel family protein [bacterium]|nr:MotA/TolQ/ExbB proton channel family protein [bacterium]MCP4800036.1 MotA/TolQ/ExbB proton channel family protein [bacterium]
MWELIQSGNVMMIPLGICSLVAVAVILERVYALRSSKVIVSEIVGAVETLDAAQDLSVARAILERNPGPFANIVETGLDHADDDWVIIRDVLQESGRQEAVRLSRNLNILEIVAAIAPLLGLLGTVTGMIRVFSAVSAHGLGQPEYMSGGISEAMITTAAGLIIGIPVLVMHQWLQGKADSIIFDMERYGSIVLDSLRRRNRSRSS